MGDTRKDGEVSPYLERPLRSYEQAIRETAGRRKPAMLRVPLAAPAEQFERAEGQEVRLSSIESGAPSARHDRPINESPRPPRRF